MTAIGAKVTKTPNLTASHLIPLSLGNKIGQDVRREIVTRTNRGRGVKKVGPGKYKEAKHTDGYSTAGALVPITSSKLRTYYRKHGLKGLNNGGLVAKSASKARYVYLQDGYRQFRQIHGRRVDIITHSFTGQMLAGIRVNATRKRIRLTFTASQMKKAYYTDKRRRWFRMTMQQTDRHSQRVVDHIVANIKKGK